MLPAHQCLDGQQLAGAQVDFGLVVQAQPVAVDGLAQGQLGARALADRLPQHLVEHDRLVAPLPLGGVEGDIGPAQQLDPVLRRPGVESTMPMLAVWLTSWPAKSMGSPMMSRIR